MGNLLDSIHSPCRPKETVRPAAGISGAGDSRAADCQLSKTGGHLGPNLGVVELTLALHYVFDTPRDNFVFDVSHQAYVHKLLTGRNDRVRYDPPAGRA